MFTSNTVYLQTMRLLLLEDSKTSNMTKWTWTMLKLWARSSLFACKIR